MKKYLAEAVGTFVLTLLGCGTAVSLACGSDTASVVGTAMAFGLSVIAMAYTIGGISGCHINPAITLGCLLTKRISSKDAVGYMAGQTVGAIIAAAVLYVFTQYSGADFQGTLTGANTCDGCGGSKVGGLIVEIVLTFIFVLVVLGRSFFDTHTPCRYSLYRYIRKPSTFYRPCSLPGRRGSYRRSLGIHRRPIHRCCSLSIRMEGYR